MINLFLIFLIIETLNIEKGMIPIMKFNSLIPELSVSNIEISKKFYLALGFQIKYERKEDKFCFLELEENQKELQTLSDKLKEIGESL